MKRKKTVFGVIILVILSIIGMVFVRQEDIKKMINTGFEELSSGFYIKNGEELMQAIAPGIFPKTYTMKLNGPLLEENEFSGIWIGKKWPWSKVEYGVSLPGGEICLMDEQFSQLSPDADNECKDKDILISENEETYDELYDFFESTPYLEKKETI